MLNDVRAERPTILLIEDNSANVALIEMLVNNFVDAEIISVSSAESGIEQANEVNPDMIITDVGLPGISGIEAIPALRDIVGMTTPIIVMTADINPETRVKRNRQVSKTSSPSRSTSLRCATFC